MADEHDLIYIKSTLSVLVEQVSKLAGAMERIATMEERSLSTGRRIESLEQRLDRFEQKLTSDFDELEKSNHETKLSVAKIVAVSTACTALCSIFIMPVALFIAEKLVG